MRRTILVTGGAGQIGIEVSRLEWPADVNLHAPSRNELDITDQKSVSTCFAATRPALVINLAAYTAVDRAEDDVAAAFEVNAQGPAYLAEAARHADAPILHVSTDYVFDGSAERPYVEADQTAPLNAYGASKLAGELAVRAANRRSIVMRTAWVLSSHRTNFIKTMLRLAKERRQLRVVDDQRGCPTSATDIAAALQRIALRAMNDVDVPWGVYHFVNSGETSWHGLAEHIFDWQAAHGAGRPDLHAVSSSEYSTGARRAAYSCLDTALISAAFEIRPRPWQEAVDAILSELTVATDWNQQGTVR